MTEPDRTNDDVLDIHAILPLWELLDTRASWAEVEYVDAQYRRDPTTLTDRRFDEAQPAGTLAHLAVRQLLQVAIEHHKAFRREVESSGVSPYAGWTLLRSVFEASAWVHWILDPQDGRARRTNGLHRKWLDLKQYNNWRQVWSGGSIADPAAVKAFKTNYDTTENSYSEMARELGTTKQKMRAEVNFVEELPKLAISRDLLPTNRQAMVGYWRHMSGHAHGYAWAVQASSNQHDEVVVPVPGGVTVTLSVNPSVFLSYVSITGYLLLTAVQLYGGRSLTRKGDLR